jgi:hypothetical protein
VVGGRKIGLYSPSNESCEICSLRRWTKPLRGRAEGRVLPLAIFLL